MPDRRAHRGPHPKDRELFSTAALPALRAATADLSWLWSRGYAVDASLKLVGDRYQLEKRQRLAVARCAAGDDAIRFRRARQLAADEIAARRLRIDGYNVLTTIEAALAHGAVIVGRDGCYRDMASMHGTYRKVEETLPAIELIGRSLAELKPALAQWLLDGPVSNSGRLAAQLRETALRHVWNWTVELWPDPDAVMIGAAAAMDEPVNVTADSVILDRSAAWFNLARHVVDTYIAEAWIVDLSGDRSGEAL